MAYVDKTTSHLYSVYFAPRGRDRMYALGMQIAQLHLSPFDRIIGVIGEAGSGKSMLIKGMFPGLELTNDDEGVNMRPLPLMAQEEESRFYSPHTYHMDVRFELGFSQMHALVDATLQAIARGKRVVIEHFDLLQEQLGMNADLILGIGEEVIVTRPNVFGPLPADIARIVHKSVRIRQMAHTAEDLCERHMTPEEYDRCEHDDIKNGFLLVFPDRPPEVDIPALEAAVREDIAAKKQLLLRHGLALWDTLESCTITGASDASIKDVVPNDIAGLLRKAPIRAVFCNGATAYRIYTKYQQPLTGIPAVRLPSTSPANAACSPARLEELWGAALAGWIVK